MGHIRLGQLPKTKPWNKIFEILKEGKINPGELAKATVIASIDQFELLKKEKGLIFCFWMLVRILTASRGKDFRKELGELGVDYKQITSGVTFVREISKVIDSELKRKKQSNLFVSLAELSLRETLSENIIERSRSLFGSSFDEVQSACKEISTKKEFGRVSSEFFAKFLNKTISFYVDKELSNWIGPQGAFGNTADVLDFHKALERYCFETARIVHEFSSGWMSKNNWESNNKINIRQAAGFTSYALEKISMELQEVE